MKNRDGQSGTIILEAALVFPVVIITVAAIMVLGMMKFQESLVQFGAQKIATAAARNAVYPNYKDYIGESAGMNIDLDSFPDSASVTNYYENNKLYGSFGKNYGTLEDYYAQELKAFVDSYSFLAGMEVLTDVDIAGVLSPVVSVEVEYKINLPRFLGYIGLPDSWKMETGAYAFAGNPTEFVRNIDIAVDVVTFFLDRLGLSDRVDVFMEKLDSVMKKIGG